MVRLWRQLDLDFVGDRARQVALEASTSRMSRRYRPQARPNICAPESGKGAPMFSNRDAHVSVYGGGGEVELRSFEYYEAEQSNMNLVDNAPCKCPTC